MSLRTLIVDDEPLARRRIRLLLAPFVEEGRISLVGEAGDVMEALEVLQQGPVDLVLLDIQMPEASGFQLVEQLARGVRPYIIFITAYDQYALRAFEVEAVDYLLKPVTTERLGQAIERVERLLAVAEGEEADEEVEQPPAPAYPDFFTVSHRDKLQVVRVEQVVSAEVQEGITQLYVYDEGKLERFFIDYTLDYLESRLNPMYFFRVHRSAIVHIPHIREMIPWFSGRYKLLLTGGHEVIASRERARMLKKRLML